MRVPRLIILIAATTLVAAACGGAASPTVSVPASTGGGDAVTIANFSFSPTPLTVNVGSTVTWTNQDSTAHTVTADDGSFQSSQIGGGGTFTQTFAKAGTFAYHCSIHPSMKATITVSS